MNNVARVFVDTLKANGIDRVFCVPGESYLPILDVFFDEPTIDVITCRQEGNAGYMALADARLTGRPGVCLVSRGPGAMNAAIAVHMSEQDCLPFLLIVGQVPRRNLRRNSFQEIDYGKMFADVAKWTVEVTDPSRIGEALARAIQAAMSGTPGPVIISLPEDVLDQAIDLDAPPAYRPPLMTPAREAIDAVADCLRSSRRPLLVAGGRLAVEGGRQALLAAAERWRVPVVVSFRRQDIFPNGHELYAGDLGLSVSEVQLEAFRDSDLLIAVGLRLDDLTTQGYRFPDMPKARQRFVHVHDDPKFVGMHGAPDLGVICDPASLLSGLAAVDPGASNLDPAWAARLRALHLAKSTWAIAAAPDGVVFGNLVSKLSGHLTEDAIVVADAGLSAALLYQYVEFRPPQMLLGTFVATMGCGVASAIGAALRYPGRSVVCVAGDGGFIMSAIELGWAVERRLPIRFILSNNGSFGSIRRDQEKSFPGRALGTDLLNPDFRAFAGSFGVATFLIDREDQIDRVMSDAFHVEGPSLIEVRSSLRASLPGFREDVR